MAFHLRIKEFLLQRRVLLVVYIVVSLFTAAQLLSLGTHEFQLDDNAKKGTDIVNNPVTAQLYVGHHYTFYNNYIVFKNSFYHLVAGKDLYAMYPDEQWDLYKYTPTFSLLMAPLAYMPDWMGLAIWTLINTLVLLAAIYMLPYGRRTNAMILWFILVELLTAIQNSQSNALLAGLVIAAYGCMQRRATLWAALWLVLATYIKPYCAAGFILFLLYPDKLKAALYTLLWVVLLGALPLLVTPFATLVWQYQNWIGMLAADQSASYGLSVMGWLHSWFGLENIKSYVTIVGVLLFFLPFVRWRMYGNEVYRLLLLAFILVWVIIFNHKAESATFIIALAGTGIWYFTRSSTLVRKILLWLVFIGTSLTVTDIFPPFAKKEFLVPYAIKVVPCILLWVVLLAELMTLKPATTLPDRAESGMD